MPRDYNATHKDQLKPILLHLGRLYRKQKYPINPLIFKITVLSMKNTLMVSITELSDYLSVIFHKSAAQPR